MNNKGQTLVVFIILLPIIFLILSIIISFGNLYIVKRNIKNNIHDAINYGLKHIELSNVQDKMAQLLLTNIDDIDSSNIYIDISDNKVTITVSKKQTVIFNQNMDIDITMSGTIKNGEITIIKE